MKKHIAGAGVLAVALVAATASLAPAFPGPVEVYTGSITRIGLDLGATTGGVMIWVVYAPTGRPEGGLAGEYAGASAEASIVAGLGANVLVGGSGSTVALQPVSVQGHTGLNLAAGIAGLELQFVR
jgi:hypothetical protein